MESIQVKKSLSSSPVSTSNKIQSGFIKRHAVVSKGADIKVYLHYNWKYLGLFHFNLASYGHSIKMAKALRRVKYMTKLGNIVVFNAKKSKVYEEAFKSFHKTTLKWQNRFSLSYSVFSHKYMKSLNRLVRNPQLLHERFTKCPMYIICRHSSLEYLCIGKQYASLNSMAIREISLVLSKLKKLKTLKLSFKDVKLLDLYQVLLKRSLCLKEVIVSVNNLIDREKLQDKANEQLRIPITHLRISMAPLSILEVFRFAPKFFTDLKSITIISNFSTETLEPIRFYDILRLPNIADVELDFKFPKGDEKVFEVVNYFSFSPKPSLRSFSINIDSEDFLAESIDDVLLNRPSKLIFKYKLNVINQENHIFCNINFPRPNPLFDFITPQITANVNHLKIDLDSSLGFVNPLKAEKLLILCGLCPNLKSISFKSQALALSKGFMQLQNNDLEEVSFHLAEIQYFVKEQFEGFLKAFMGLKKLQRFCYSTRQKQYNKEICLELNKFAKMVPTLAELNIEIDIENMDHKEVTMLIESNKIETNQHFKCKLTLLNSSLDITETLDTIRNESSRLTVLSRNSY